MDRKFNHNIKGFTLISLVISIAVFIILAMMVIPSLQSTLHNSRLKAASNAFAQQLHLAQSEAIERQKNIYFSITTGSQWCTGINENAACSCSPTNNCGIETTSYQDYSAVTLSINTGFSTNSVYFDSIRGLPNEAGEVTFQEGDKLVKVNLNATGQVSFCATNVPGYPAC